MSQATQTMLSQQMINSGTGLLIAGILSVSAASTAVLAQSKQAPLDDTCWEPSFVEQFNELNLHIGDASDNQTDSHSWKTSYIWGSDIVINNELQYYVNPQEHGVNPFSIEDGILTISATQTPDSLRDTVQNRPYVSGVLTSEKGFSQQYGRFEVRAQVPAGKGLWSAFWLLPSFEQWPEGVAILPEIDVMEHIGDQPRTYHTTLHTNQSGKLESYPFDHSGNENLTKQFHLYSVVWTDEQVSWYFDGKWKASHPTPKDFTRPVHFLLNLAVGGNWPGAPDESTQFPAHYRIDYVKAYTDNGRC